ncbi:MAG: bifunctional phosphopantothenoylcysteine decarboxylase/phosphopantothenate--cysteine ligase CoaBC [Eubacteriales bacterium]
MLNGKKNVLLAVTGSIAAYKAADIARGFIKKGYTVTVMLTANGAKFITPMTFETLTGSKCLVDTFDRNFKYEVEHIAAAKACDLLLVAPASANVIGKIAGGIADDMVTTTILAVTSPKLIAPAMNTAMYDNPIVQDNMKKLKAYGYQFIDPAEGLLACGDTGRGKLADVEDILSVSQGILMSSEKSGALAQEIPEESENGGTLDFEGRTVVVTAGPTQEALDPVRYITNHSSGKMGYSLGEAAAKRGAKVVLISGPTALKKPENENISFVPVVSASDMAEAVFTHFEKADILIMAAAVADYTPKTVADQKIKKADGGMTIELARTTDILGTLKDRKREGQFICGFSMETENLIENSRKKLFKKNLDIIAANSIVDPGAGFGHDTNKVTIIARDGEESLPLISKAETADRILDAIIKRVK